MSLQALIPCAVTLLPLTVVEIGSNESEAVKDVIVVTLTLALL